MKRETKARLTALNKKVQARKTYEERVQLHRAEGYSIVYSRPHKTVLIRAGRTLHVWADGLVMPGRTTY